MTRVVGAALLGAMVGGVLLAIVAAVGPDPAVTIPMPQANGTVRRETISLASIVSKLAVILGVCTGALIGGLAGAVASRHDDGGSSHAARIASSGSGSAKR